MKHLLRPAHRHPGLFGERCLDEELWPGYVDLFQPDSLHALYERGKVLVYSDPKEEERWFLYTADDAGKGTKAFQTIVTNSLLIFTPNLDTEAQTTWEGCRQLDENAEANHETFRDGLTTHNYVRFEPASGVTDSAFVTAWNAAASSAQFKLFQGSYTQGTGAVSVSHVGYVLWRFNAAQYWLLFNASGNNGEVAYEYIGVDPSTSINNAATKGTLKFVTGPTSFTTGDLSSMPAHTILKLSKVQWP